MLKALAIGFSFQFSGLRLMLVALSASRAAWIIAPVTFPQNDGAGIEHGTT
jgi:hypothetical protein